MRASTYVSLSAIIVGIVAAARSAQHVGKKLPERAPRSPRFLEDVQYPQSNKRQSVNITTSKFAVNGSAIPDVGFDIGESYAGLLPISDKVNETRELYFWYFPSTNPLADDEITIWLNGGPGCSALEGLLQEQGF